MKSAKASDYFQYVPFLRLGKPNAKGGVEQAISGFSVYPEIGLVVLIFLSVKIWNYQTNTPLGIITLVLWCLILVQLFTLALTNAKTLLLPDKLVRLFGVSAILYVLAEAALLQEASLIVSSVLGGLLLGGIPYILFQISAGRWIGGGDVKLGFVAGLLLGWKYGLLCLGLMVGLVILTYFAEYVAGKLSRSGHFSRITTGTLWSAAIITSMLLSR